MKKRNAVISLIIMAALVAGLCYTAIVGLGADKSGSISKIHLGLDLAGGVSITYQAVGETAPSSEDMADTVYKLQKRVDQGELSDFAIGVFDCNDLKLFVGLRN